MHWRLFLTSVTICLGGGLHFGIQLTVLNPSESVFQDFINSTHNLHYGSHLSEGSYRILWSVILNLVFAGTVLGTIPLVKLSETLGRRKTFYVSCGFLLFGLVCQVLSKVASSYELLAIGRLAVGIGCGITLPLQCMYFNEISPLKLRGFIGGLTGISLELGYISGGVLALPAVLGTQNHWFLIFILEAVPVIVLLIIVPFLHESPRYLVSRQQLDAAKKSLEFFGHKDPMETIEEIQIELQAQKNEATWREIWYKPYLRRALLLSITLMLTVALSGTVVIDFFSTKILQDVGLSLESAQYGSVGIFSGSLVASLIGGFFVDRVGRRVLLVTSTFIFILVNIALMTFSFIHQIHNHMTWAGVGSVVACGVFTLAFGFGPTLIQWVVISELVPQKARSRVQLVAMLVRHVVGGIIGFTFFPLQGIAGPFAFLLFIIPLIGFFIIFLLKFPETKRMTPMEIMKKLGFVEDGIV